jgi:cytochrome c553
MPRHIARLIILMVGFGAVAYAAKIFFTANSFYAYGHYRGDSVAEIASDKPKYKGSEYCRSCHAERYAEWSKGVHHSVDVGKVVQCEVCHQAAGGRDVGGMFQHVATGVDHPASGKLTIPADTLKLCPLCHEKMPGRPAEQRQIDIATHAGTQQCTTCHNPHSPKIILAVAAPGTQPGGNAAAGKAAICAGCHGADGVSINPVWPNLAGQHSAYLVEALKAYKTGSRQNAMMSATAKGLSDADMLDLAGHYATLKNRSVVSAGRAPDLAAGKAKAAACAACHGEGGVSSNPAWPSLAGQQKDYLVAALKAYRDGSRNNEMMAGMAKGLSDADMETLAAYFSSVSTN